MAAPRLDYEDPTIGALLELVSVIVSLSPITRAVSAQDVEHARDHALAALDLVKQVQRARCAPRLNASDEGPGPVKVWE